MLTLNHLLRAAKHLQEAWSRTSKHFGGSNDVLLRSDACLRGLQNARQRLDKAHRLQLSAAVATLRQEMLAQLQCVQQNCSQALRDWHKTPVKVPSLRTLLEELQQIDADFGGVDVNWRARCISATTESITLQEVHLGPFQICFYWDRLPRAIDPFCFEVVAMRPNPAPTNDNITHPHVRSSALCPGDADVPLRRALAEGRLADAFTLIHSVLATYNPNSPHAALEEWDGVTCHECGDSVSKEDACYCEGCWNDYCSECCDYCAGCRDCRCDNCLRQCSTCQRSFCPRCVTASASGTQCRACRARDSTSAPSPHPSNTDPASPGSPTEEIAHANSQASVPVPSSI